MKHPLLQTVAQEIVDAIKPLVGDRTINIMETGGLIVASSDPGRIGTLHQGAVEAAKTGRIIRIKPGEVSAYPGAREGINLPIVKNGELLGVVGIYGIPEEVEQTANLLRACVDLYLDQALTVRKTQLRRDMHLALLRRMLLGELVDQNELLAGGRELSLDLRLPVRVMTVMLGKKVFGNPYRAELLNRMYALVVREGWMDENRDVLAVMDEALVLVKYAPAGFGLNAFAERIHARLTSELGIPVTMASGSLCDDWRQLAHSHHEAMTLAGLSDGACIAIDAQNNRMMYMLKNCLRMGASDRYLAARYQDLVKGFGERDMNWVMETIGAYCAADCRCAQAAETLNIHKNTMNYRINKILALLGMEGENGFVREFFLRLLLLYRRQRGERE